MGFPDEASAPDCGLKGERRCLRLVNACVADVGCSKRAQACP